MDNMHNIPHFLQKVVHNVRDQDLITHIRTQEDKALKTH